MPHADINHVVLVGRLTRDPQLGRCPPAALSADCASPATASAGTEMSTRSVPTTSTSAFSEPTGRTSSAICAKAPAWPSQADWIGASGKPPTVTSARPSASSPTPCSSSTPPAAPRATDRRRRRTAHLTRGIEGEHHEQQPGADPRCRGRHRPGTGASRTARRRRSSTELARTAGHACWMARARPPRLLVLGELDGPRGTIDLLESIRADPPERDNGQMPSLWPDRLPVIVLSARTTQADLLRAFEAGADDFLGAVPATWSCERACGRCCAAPRARQKTSRYA